MRTGALAWLAALLLAGCQSGRPTAPSTLDQASMRALVVKATAFQPVTEQEVAQLVATRDAETGTLHWNSLLALTALAARGDYPAEDLAKWLEERAVASASRPEDANRYVENFASTLKLPARLSQSLEEEARNLGDQPSSTDVRALVEMGLKESDPGSRRGIARWLIAWPLSPEDRTWALEQIEAVKQDDARYWDLIAKVLEAR